MITTNAHKDVLMALMRTTLPSNVCPNVPLSRTILLHRILLISVCNSVLKELLVVQKICTVLLIVGGPISPIKRQGFVWKCVQTDTLPKTKPLNATKSAIRTLTLTLPHVVV